MMNLAKRYVNNSYDGKACKINTDDQ